MRKTWCSGACAVVVGGYAKKLWEAVGGATRERKSAHTEKEDGGGAILITWHLDSFFFGNLGI